MDGVFGKHNLLNEIVCYYKTGGVSKRWFGRKHDTILLYSKSDRHTFNPLKEKSYLTHRYGFSNIEIFQDEMGPYTIVGMRDVWDIPALRGNQSESTGYPTQKPLTLYERVIEASSNPNNIVLDPFAVCATTPIAAERLGRQWIGIDIWQGAHRLVLERLDREFLSVPEVASGRLFSLGDVTYTKKPPTRTDDRIEAAPELILRDPQRVPKYQRLSHDRMKSYLADAQRNWRGRVICAGCGRGYDIRMMHLDHKRARSEGGR